MVGRYTRKTDRQTWSEETMVQAIQAVQDGKMGWLKAAKTFGVPRSTLRRRARNKNKKFNGAKKGLGRYDNTFSAEMEKKLVEYILLLESRMFSLTCDDIRSLAFQLAEKNNIPHRFNHDEEKAGWDWLRGFRLRHPELSLRQLEPTSAAPIQAFVAKKLEEKNEEDVKSTETLSDDMAKENIDESNTQKVDESEQRSPTTDNNI